MATYSKSQGPWASPDKLLSLDTEIPEAQAKETEGDELAAWKANPTPQNAAPLIKRMQPTIDGALRSYAKANPGAYRTQANLLTLEAMRTYKPEQGAKLTTHVFNSLQKLHRIQSERENFVHVPENKEIEYSRITKASQEFEAEKGREPNMHELADITRLSVKRLEKLYRQQQPGFRPESAVSSDDKGDVLVGDRRDPAKIWAEYVYAELDPIDKKIYEWSTGYGGRSKIAKSEMAAKLRITPAAVSSRVTKILKKLEEGKSLNVS